jgi:hypothetical protein
LLHAAGQRCTSLLLTPAETWRVAPIADDLPIASLFAIYHRGCSELLPFFPATSLNWLKAQRDGKQTYWLKDWTPSAFNHGAESMEAYNDLAWRDCDPFSIDFERLAGQVYGAMLEQTESEAEA